MASNLRYYFDPVCPFCWMTSTWVRQVQAQRDYEVDWRFISLRLVNESVDYDSHFPPEYEVGHTTGLRLLRVAAAAREAGGNDAVARLYEAYGAHCWESDPVDWVQLDERGGLPGWTRTCLAEAGLDEGLADALDDERHDQVIRAETDEALAATGKDVGTPIVHVDPPEGVAFFGPVISRRPSDEDAVELWEHVVALARHPGFSELKRSLRERPQLRGMGVAEGEAGTTEDWHGGSRRLKK